MESSPTDAAASDEESLSSMPNSDKKPAAGLKQRFDEEEVVEDPILFEKQKVFNLVLDTSMRMSAIKETSFESMNNCENLFITGDERSSIEN